MGRERESGGARGGPDEFIHTERERSHVEAIHARGGLGPALRQSRVITD